MRRNFISDILTDSCRLYSYAMTSLCTMIICSCTSAKATDAPTSDADDVTCNIKLDSEAGKPIVNHSQQSFAVSAFQSINREYKQNMVFSPMGIEALYSILRDGANGETRNEIDSVLGMTSKEARDIAKDIDMPSDSDGTVVNMANLIAVNKKYTLKDYYKKDISKGYGAEIWSKDFTSSSTPKDINDWVIKKTNGMINNAIDELNPDDVMCGVNTLYFNGQWFIPFETTEPTIFTELTGKKVKVDMMRMDHSKEFGYFETKDFKAVALPYIERINDDAKMQNFALYAFLPLENKDFGPILRYIKENSFTKIRKEMDDFGTKKFGEPTYLVDARIPKFEASAKIDVKSVLKSLGIIMPFDEYNANFDKISSTKTYISQSRQKAIIKVDEAGTEAAAETDVYMAVLSASEHMQIKVMNFYADHPFIYMIVCEDNNTILFMGQYTEGKTNKNGSWVTDEDIKGAITCKEPEVSPRSSNRNTEDYESKNYSIVDGNKVYDCVEQMPAFPGGNTALLSYLEKNIKYPAEAKKKGIKGRVILTFVVRKDGSISDVKVVKSVEPSLDKEALRVVKSMPKWIPGKQNGKVVDVKYTIPVTFRLNSVSK